MTRSWFTVLCGGEPIGRVLLARREITAGRLSRFPAYGPHADVVQAASRALLEIGLFGAAITPHDTDDVTRMAVAAAALLPLTLQDYRGNSVPTRFLNLFATPADQEVVVLARLADGEAAVSATLSPTHKVDKGTAGAA